MLRTFIAVKIAPTPPLEQVLARLAAFGWPVRAVAADKLHVTLKFLGETQESLVPEISRVLEHAVSERPAFSVTLAGLGAFPSPTRPNSIWAGLQNAQTLMDIAADLENTLARLGFAPEQRPFTPHLTLARVKARPPTELAAILQQYSQAQFGPAPIDDVEYLSSELLPAGPRYATLAAAKLQERS